jgi:hypothetical protein
MMILITAVLALIVGFLIAFALLLGGWWKAPEQIKQQIVGLPGRLLAGFRTAWKWVKHRATASARKKRALPDGFRAWAATELGDKPDLQAWLLSLPEPGFRALTEGTVRYCADLKIELSWLTERHTDVAPPVREATSVIVTDYLEGCWRAVCHKNAIALFGLYRKLVAEPADSRHIDLRRQTFNRVTALGLAAPVPAYELIMASERQRQSLAAKAIREAAAADWDAFAQAFAELLAGGGPAA